MKREVFKYSLCILIFGAWVSTAFGESPSSGDKCEELSQRITKLNNLQAAITSEMEDIVERFKGGDDRVALQALYLDFELELLEVRSQLKVVEDSLTLLSWSDIAPQPIEEESEPIINESEAYAFSADERFIKGLGEQDMNNLKRSEALERSVSLSVSEYIKLINELANESESYNAASSQSEGAVIKQRYDSLLVEAKDIAQEIDEDWSYIYDNKSFSCDFILEVSAKSELVGEIAALRDSTRYLITELDVQPSIKVISEYILQKSEILSLESMTAKALNMHTLIDSLAMASEAFSKMPRNFPDIELIPRSFIDYRPSEILEKQIYTADNPIPQTRVYESGVIYRIRVGSFSKKQPASIFRFASEVSYVEEPNRWVTYYLGGYATYSEAVEAQKMLKAAGFRRPEVVIWNDGVLRDLVKEPYAHGDIYRIELTDCQSISEELAQEIKTVAKGATISKIGATTYAISPLEGESLALQLAQIVAGYGSEIKIELKKL